MSCDRRWFGRARPALVAVAVGALAVAGTGCDIDVFLPIDYLAPAGAISGYVTYSSVPPCTAGGHIVGAAVLLAFEEKLLPPPEGLGTTAAGLTLVSGEVLFKGIRDQLPFDPDGALVCPPPGTAPVVVSAPFAIAPLTAGSYQVRGFYDYDQNFDGGFSLFNLPTKGDIGGGAIANAADVLLGAAPEYSSIPQGVRQPDGTWVMPDTGWLVDNVSVTLGLVLPLDRPLFHYADVLDQFFGNDDPAAVTIPSDYQLDTFDTLNIAATEASFVRLKVKAGLPADEVDAGSANPFYFPTDNPFFYVSTTDADHDGVADSIPESTLVPALAPQGILNKIADSADYTAQAGPSIILQGVTLLSEGFFQTVIEAASLPKPKPDVIVALRPAVLCIDVADSTKPAVLLNSHETDKHNNVLVNWAELQPKLEAQFGREVNMQFGCLPQGRYALNLIYDTGQAWTLPNEAGICMPGEVSKPLADGSPGCEQSGLPGRAILQSQSVVVTVGPPEDDQYCVDNPTPPECLPPPPL